MYLPNLTCNEEIANPAMLFFTSYKQQLKKFRIFTKSVTAYNFRAHSKYFRFFNEMGTYAYTNYGQKSSVVFSENDQRNQSTVLEYSYFLSLA